MRYLNRKSLNELAEIIVNVEVLAERARGGELSASIEEVLSVTARQLNYQLYMSRDIDLISVSPDWRGDGDIRSQVVLMLPVWKRSLERRRGKKIDNEFGAIYEYFRLFVKNSG